MKKEKADALITSWLEKIYGFAVKKSFSYAEAEELASDIVEEVYTSLLKRDEIYKPRGLYLAHQRAHIREVRVVEEKA